MVNAQSVGDYTFTITSVAITPATAGNMLAQVNVEGTATGFGSIVGTVTATPAGHASGTWQSHAVFFLDSGEPLSGTAQGTFTSVGPKRWRLRGLFRDSLGRALMTDGEMDLATRTWQGKLFSTS